MLFSLFPAAAFADEPAAAEQADEPAAETADGSGALPDGALVEEPLSEEPAPEAPPAEAAPVEEPVLEAIPASNNGNPVYYLKGGMNGWEQSDDLVLSGPNADGVYSKTFSLDAATELKVYASDDTWYGEGGSTSGGNVSVGLTGSLTVYFKPGEFLNVSDSSLGNGYYLVGNMNGWTENAAYQLSAFDSSIQYLDLNLNADSELKVTFFNYGARQWISPGDGQASYVPGKSGAMRVYFRPNGQGDENLWFSTVLRAVPIAAVTDGCFFVGSMNAWTPAEANRLIAYGSSFFLHVTGIPADSTFKVVRYSDSGMNEAWYPSGDNLALSEGGEYGITYSPNSGNNITIQSSPYNLPVEKVGNGTVTLSPSSVYSGDTVTVNAVPDEGYGLSSIKTQFRAGGSWITNKTLEGNSFFFTNSSTFGRVLVTFEPITYTVATVQPANGTVSVDVDAPVAAGTVVTVTATPSENYALDAITVTDANGDPVAVSNGQFTMPASNVTVTASFVYVPVLDDGFYLIGPDWSTASLKGRFTVNPDNSSEYQLAATLAAGDKLKVVKVERDAITAWYPDGAGNEYTVDAAHAGDVTIYFKSSYDEAWSSFGGFIWIAPVVVNYTVTCAEAEHGLVSASPASAPAGTSITLTVTPEDGYVLDTLSVTKQSGGAVEVSNNAFLMPEDNVTVTASFVAVSPITVYLDDEPGGTIEADKTSVLPGEVLTLTLTPDSGKYLEKLEYQWINHYQRYPIEVSGSTVQFTIPAPEDNADTIMFLPTWKTDYSGISLSITLTASYAGAASYTYATPTTPIYDTTVREAFYKWGSDFMFYLPYPNPFDAAAPAGYEFSRWVDQDGNTCMYFSNPVNSTGSITMTSPTLTVTAVYEKASYTKDFQSSITITPDTVWTDCPFHFSELVFAGQANSMYVKMETGTTTTNSSFGKLTKSDGSNDTLQFKLGMKDLPHNQSDECYAVSWQTQNTYFYSTDDTRYLGVYIPAEEWAKATPGTYTGNIHWSLDFGNLIHEDGVIPISLTIPEPSYEISTSATHGTVESDKESAQAGDTVTLTVTPDEGYRLFKLTAVDADSRKVEVTNNQFIMPASSVTVTATFVEQTPYYLVFSSSPDSADPQYQFTVTPTSDPFYSLGGVYVLEDISLPEGAQVRVGRYNGSSFECYYPADGYYTVCSGHWDDNNQIDVYFNTEMQQDTRYTVGSESYDMRWSHFGGYF